MLREFHQLAAAIFAVPTNVTDSLKRVVYKPARNFNGAAWFNFSCFDGSVSRRFPFAA